MSQLRLGADPFDAWASPFPADNLGLGTAQRPKSAKLERALTKACTKYYCSLAANIAAASARVHNFTETVNNYKVRLEAAPTLTHYEISKMSSDFRSQLMGYLMPTFVDSDHMQDCQVALATVLRAGQVAAEPLPTPPPLPPPPPPLDPLPPPPPYRPPLETPPAPQRPASEPAPAGAGAVVDELQQSLQNVARWVVTHQQDYSPLEDDEQKQVEVKTKKVYKMKKISDWKPYKRLEEEVDSNGQGTSDVQPPAVAAGDKTSSSTEYLTPEQSPLPQSGSGPEEPPYSMTFVHAPPNTPDGSPASGNGVNKAVALLSVASNLQVSTAEETQTAHGGEGVGKDMQSTFEARDSDGSKITKRQTPAGVADGVQLIAPSPVGTNGEMIEPAPVSDVAIEEGIEKEPGPLGASGEDNEQVAMPVGASGEDAEPGPGPLEASGQNAEPASVPVKGSEEEPSPKPVYWVVGPKRNWVRAAMSSVVKAMKAARPSVPASGPDSPAYSVAVGGAPAGRDVTGANGNGSGDGNGTEGSAISSVKPPSVVRFPITRYASAREVLEELQRQHGIFRSALLRHSNRLWLEVRGRPDTDVVQGEPRDARHVLLTSLKRTLRDVELELRDVQRHMEIRAGCVADIGQTFWAGKPPAAVAQARGGAEFSGELQALEAGDLGLPSSPPPSPPPPAAEHSWGRVFGLLCSCFTCLPRRQ